MISFGFILSLTYTFAKYVGNTIWDYYLSTKGFYLSSDKLSDDIKENANDYWDKERVYFNIKNSQNKLLITDYDIEYEVSCRIIGDASLSSDCLLEGTDLSAVTGVLSATKLCVNNTEDGIIVDNYNKAQCDNGGYNWESQIASKDLYFDIVFNDEELSDVTAEITFISTSPYKKTLTGQFLLKNSLLIEDNITLKYEDNTNTGNLIISNPALKSKIIELSWDTSQLLIDEDSSYIDSYTATDNKINKVYLIMNPKSSINLLFYKATNNININEQNFNTAIINENDYKPETLLRNMILNQNGGLEIIDSKGSPDFSVSSRSDTGVYKMLDDYGSSYYFRGNKDLLNNNLIFAEHQWKIVRINGDGSIKLIYNGICSNNICTINNTGSNTNIITSYWNNIINDNKYVGYMYGGEVGVASTNLTEATKNQTNSNIKTVLEEWYKQNISNKGINIISNIEDKIFCNDRSIDEENKGFGVILTTYNSNLRILQNNNPNLTCTNKNDRFTTRDADLGNGALTFPVGLLTVDEVNIAGIIPGIQNYNNYLYTQQNYWLFSPSNFGGQSAYNFIINNQGSLLNVLINNSYGIRPVINISSSVRAIGNGSTENPYLLKVQ
ncbi:MAG: hypothetical protein PHX19_00465 [Bacilli bacterium]|nr:hypothetical protein [Bacilli bacterium]